MILFFQKITKTVLMAVAEEATDIFFYELNGYNCLPHNSFDLSVFLFQEDFKCIENHKQICCLYTLKFREHYRILGKS